MFRYFQPLPVVALLRNTFIQREARANLELPVTWHRAFRSIVEPCSTKFDQSDTLYTHVRITPYIHWVRVVRPRSVPRLPAAFSCLPRNRDIYARDQREKRERERERSLWMVQRAEVARQGVGTRWRKRRNERRAKKATNRRELGSEREAANRAERVARSRGLRRREKETGWKVDMYTVEKRREREREREERKVKGREREIWN